MQAKTIEDRQVLQKTRQNATKDFVGDNQL